MAVPPVKMQCGHAANSLTQNGEPACAICAGVRPGWDAVETAHPNLEGRKAFCSYRFGPKGMHGEVQSNLNLAFFEHRPDEPYDLYYCGCFGWD